MKKFVSLTLFLLLLVPSVSFAQDDEHSVELGVFFDYLRLDAASQNFYGVGGRFGFNPHPNVGLEAEMAYDFAQDVSTSGVTTSSLRILPALFGVKIHSNGPIRLFGTFKTGFVNFSSSTSSASPSAVGSSFTGALSGIENGDTHAAFYPGGGIELGGGTFGLRLEVGDLMYFANGTRHNLKVTVGPQIRF